MWLRTCLCLLVIVVCGAVSVNSPEISFLQCPDACRCLTTPEGLHKASCFSAPYLKKFSQNNKHHNINILDLSYSNITKINDDLDKFTELVSLDLSSNSIKYLNRFLPNSKKLVYLDLKNNLLKKFSASVVPRSVSSLNLQNNFLENVPSDLYLLKDLEHLELKGNPIHCSCENVKIFNKLLSHHIVIDDVTCVLPSYKKGKSMVTLKISDVCSKENKKVEFVPELLEDMMFGDAPADAEVFGTLTTNKKLMEVSEESILNGETWEGTGSHADNDDDKEFYGVVTEESTHSSISSDPFLEASGDDELIPYTHSEIPPISPKNDSLSGDGVEEFGSGDSGSGGLMIPILFSTSEPNNEDDYIEGSGNLENETTTTELYITGLFNPFYLGAHELNDTIVEPLDIPEPERPKVYLGTPEWEIEAEVTTRMEISTSVAPIPKSAIEVQDDIIKKEVPKLDAEEISRNKMGSDSGEYSEESKPHQAKTSVGTYICIGIILALLVGLIALTLIKGRIRKDRDRRNTRQQKNDIEKGAKEMVDMNKSLLGKPAIIPEAKDKKSNGNYERVPTFETLKKSENGNVLDSAPQRKNNTEEPKTTDDNQKPNKLEPVKNGNTKTDIPTDAPPINCVTPTKSELDGPHLERNGFADPDLLLSPTEYIPVYSPDMGRVKIKLTETQKPKTPVLINRSRSNAGDIIITPAVEQISPSKSMT
ncbi:leucine rich repeat protein windpipe [Arctopsyche grandis]|uniref:leucine rich repeat protein windpipe n=1 Tax=Arctopsyche grandis TaxID=121162 RepID=UPI00406D98D3